MQHGMNQTDYKYFTDLLSEDISLSKLPGRLVKESAFQNLRDAGILEIVKAGRGKTVRIINHEAFTKFLRVNFPDAAENNSRASNIAKFRNSKAASNQGYDVCFLRGTQKIRINDTEIDIKEYTKKYGLFAIANSNIAVNKLCIVENLEAFMNAEFIFDSDFIFLHKYGRLGTGLLSRITAKEVIVFSDYDLIGLNEYLLIKKTFPLASLYIPNDFDNLFSKYSALLPEKQTASTAVKNSLDEVVIKLRDKILKTNRFLEQEILLHKNES